MSKNKSNKIKNFVDAHKKLSEAVKIYKTDPNNTIYQDALIQRFEFTFELSWKALKEFMILNGLKDDLNFPKQILKEAFQLKIIKNENIWLEMLNARNLTSHIYDGNVASQIANNICEKFWFELEELTKHFIYDL